VGADMTTHELREVLFLPPTTINGSKRTFEIYLPSVRIGFELVNMPTLWRMPESFCGPSALRLVYQIQTSN